MQWVKRYWDQNFPGGAYDPLARRKGKAGVGAGAGAGSGMRTATGARRTAAGSAGK